MADGAAAPPDKSSGYLLITANRLAKLKEEVEFLRWSLNGGQRQELHDALAQSKHEVARLRARLKELEPPPQDPVLTQPRNSQSPRAYLLSVTREFAGESGQSLKEYVVFMVDENGVGRDVAREADRVPTTAELP